MYLGCYKDSEESRDIGVTQVTLPDPSVENCAIQCQTSGYPYAGLQMASMCFCGDSYGSLGLSVG